MKNRNNLPIFGVGPFYVITCLIITLFSLLLIKNGHFKFATIKKEMMLHSIFNLLAYFFIIFGIYLWVRAVIIQKVNKKVQQGILLKDGIYSIVRNPIYSAFLFIFTGVLFLSMNYILLVLPFFFWIFLTLLMKNTEEKWLREKFGKEYIDYCKDVNRVIPWFAKNKY